MKDLMNLLCMMIFKLSLYAIMSYLIINLENNVFLKDIKFRQALYYSIDKLRICSNLYECVASINDFVPKGMRNYIYNEKSNFNPKKAIKLFNNTRFNISKKKITLKDSNIKIVTFPKFVNKVKDLYCLDNYNVDFIMCAADLPENKIQLVVNQYCIEKRIPFSFAFVGINTGSWGPLIIPEKTVCYKCFIEEEEKKMSEIEVLLRGKMDNSITKASFGPINTIISAYQAKEIIFSLSGYNNVESLKTRCSYNLLSNKIKKYSSVLKCCNCYSR